MRKIRALVVLLVLTVTVAPTPAQALVTTWFSDLFPTAPGESITLLLTGIALLSLASVGRARPR